MVKKYNDINTKLRENTKTDFEKHLFKLMNNSVFQKTLEMQQKHRDIKLIKINRRRFFYLVSEPNYHTAKLLSKNLLTKETKKNINE